MDLTRKQMLGGIAGLFALGVFAEKMPLAARSTVFSHIEGGSYMDYEVTQACTSWIESTKPYISTLGITGTGVLVRIGLAGRATSKFFAVNIVNGVIDDSVLWRYGGSNFVERTNGLVAQRTSHLAVGDILRFYTSQEVIDLINIICA